MDLYGDSDLLLFLCGPNFFSTFTITHIRVIKKERGLIIIRFQHPAKPCDFV